jgi:hypothetical protein
MFQSVANVSQSYWVPPNCRFYVDDLQCMPWEFPHTFDYIHARALAGGIENWQSFYKEVFNSLSRDGLFEIEEHDFILESDDDSLCRSPSTVMWMSLLDQAATVAAKPLNVASHHRGWMQASGFSNIQETVFTCPVGTWRSDPRSILVGSMMRAQIALAIPAWTLFLVNTYLGWPVAQIEALVEDVLDEVLDPDKHFYVKWHFVSGYRRQGS